MALLPTPCEPEARQRKPAPSTRIPKEPSTASCTAATPKAKGMALHSKLPAADANTSTPNTLEAKNRSDSLQAEQCSHVEQLLGGQVPAMTQLWISRDKTFIVDGKHIAQKPNLTFVARNTHMMTWQCKGQVSDTPPFGGLVSSSPSNRIRKEWTKRPIIQFSRGCRATVQAVAKDGCKSNGYYFKTTRMRRTSSRRSISLQPSQNGRCTKLLKIPKSECPDIWTRQPKHKWPKSWSSMEDPVVLVERNL